MKLATLLLVPLLVVAEHTHTRKLGGSKDRLERDIKDLEDRVKALEEKADLQQEALDALEAEVGDYEEGQKTHADRLTALEDSATYHRLSGFPSLP